MCRTTAGRGRACLFRDADPFGFILFARNIVSPPQVRALTDDLRDCVGRADAPVLVDQEGGRVARLKPPYWRVAPPAACFGALYADAPEAALEAARLNARLIAADLVPCGIDVDCAPVLDVTVPGAHGIIGDRAFGDTPAVVAALGRAQAEGLLAGGVMPVMKHLPGHGRARADSHVELPVVEASRAVLEASDFVPFRALADLPWAMTAHVLYRSISGNRPATTSDVLVRDVIRGHIGFDGLLLTDDLSMGALAGSYAERVRASLAAGCDVVLHCNGDMAQMREIAAATKALTPQAQARIGRAGALRAAAADSADAEAIEHMRRRLAVLMDRPVA
jgi:beta-N-acetylhexosaminidase